MPVLLQKWEEMLRDGFMEMGDVMEQRGPEHIVWIDRKKKHHEAEPGLALQH